MVDGMSLLCVPGDVLPTMQNIKSNRSELLKANQRAPHQKNRLATHQDKQGLSLTKKKKGGENGKHKIKSDPNTTQHNTANHIRRSRNAAVSVMNIFVP